MSSLIAKLAAAGISADAMKAGLTAALVAASAAPAVFAAEGASGFYLLGTKGSLAGIAPPPGTYVTSDNYFYNGDAGASVQLPTEGGELGVGLDASAFVSVNAVTRVITEPVLNGRFGYGLVLPVVYKDVSALATLDLNGNPLTGARNGDTFAFGDPLLTAFAGWDSGNWHTTASALLNIPVGSYTEGDLANAGFNRWGLDTTVAFTYLNQDNGREFTIAPGLTFNDKNRDTGYRTGTEFHVEFAAMQHFSETFAAGLTGYHYEQIEGDSGTAPRGFKGRATALGPAVNYTFLAGSRPVMLKAKILQEFNTRNRFEGTAALVQLAVPLGG